MKSFKLVIICFGVLCFALTELDKLQAIVKYVNKLLKTEDSCNGWTLYRDDKCIKLLDTLENYENAQQICNKHDKYAELLSIRSIKEQEFIIDYVSKSGSVDDIWIGAKRDENNFTNFIYQDNTAVEYTNWDPIELQNNRDECVVLQMSSNNVKQDKKWKFVSCMKRNLVLCQYMLSPSNVKLNVRLSDLKEEFDENTVDSEIKIKILKKELEKANNIIENLSGDLSFSNQRIAHLTESLTDSKKTIDQMQEKDKMKEKNFEDLKKTVDNSISFWQFMTYMGIAIVIVVISILITKSAN